MRYFEQPQHVSSQAAGRPPKVKEAPASAPQPQGEVVVSIPLAELHPFPNHPSKVRGNDALFHKVLSSFIIKSLFWTLPLTAPAA